MPELSGFKPQPWGWSADAVRKFRLLGLDGPFPDVDKIRMLSHRRTTLRLYDLLTPDYPRPMEVSDIRDLPDTNNIFLKAPWSCSGRGVIDCSGMSRSAIESRAAGTIRRQGSVMVEPRLEKIRDFAMLFESRGGIVEYRGLSLFYNNSATAYGGNIIASEEELADRLGIDPKPTACAVADALTALLGADYEGPIGVDMMLYGPDHKICPCVEINLRLTMGFVALGLRRFFPRGLFAVTPSVATITLPDGKVIPLV